jgi:hypothetical protein
MFSQGAVPYPEWQTPGSPVPAGRGGPSCLVSATCRHAPRSPGRNLPRMRGKLLRWLRQGTCRQKRPLYLPRPRYAPQADQPGPKKIVAGWAAETQEGRP